jgi:hypothetical protein
VHCAMGTIMSHIGTASNILPMNRLKLIVIRRGLLTPLLHYKVATKRSLDWPHEEEELMDDRWVHESRGKDMVKGGTPSEMRRMYGF